MVTLMGVGRFGSIRRESSVMQDKESATIRIQYWWRKKLREQLDLAERAAENAKMRSLSKISLRNDELVEKLKKLQIEKDIEMTKYETILNRPARDVPMLLRCSDKSFLRESAEDIIREKTARLKRDNAAKVLQRTFRKLRKKKIRSDFEKKILRIRPKRRLELMSVIGERLEKGKTIQTSTLDNFKRQINSHNRKREHDISQMLSRELLLEQLNRDYKILENLDNMKDEYEVIRQLNVGPSPAMARAAEEHKKEMEKIEEMIYQKI